MYLFLVSGSYLHLMIYMVTNTITHTKHLLINTQNHALHYASVATHFVTTQFDCITLAVPISCFDLLVKFGGIFQNYMLVIVGLHNSCPTLHMFIIFP